MYFVALIIHVFCAIAFVGYVFFDAVIFPMAKKFVKDEDMQKVKKAYAKGGAKVFGTAFLLLILSGLYMAKSYLGGEDGWFGSTFQILLLSKIALLLLMCAVTAYSIFFVVILKKPDPFGSYSHIIAVILCFGIVFLAKAMWTF